VCEGNAKQSLTIPTSLIRGESHMNADQLFGQIRPILSLAGSILIAVGLVDFAGFGNIPGNGLETAVAGFLLKHI